MQTTMELLQKALAVQPSAKAWCDELGMTRNTLAVAKIRGRLSPIIAGGIAMKIGENPIQWMALAALEAEPESGTKKKLLRRLTSLYLLRAWRGIFPTAPMLCTVN